MEDTKKIPFKNGGTFQYTFSLKKGKGSLENFIGIRIEAAVKTADGAIWPLEVTVLGGSRSFRVTYLGSTKGWPQGDAAMDIKLTRLEDGLIQYSDNLEFKVIKSIA
jgi:hypothetical protein